jgi:hypothetical protein
MTTMEYLQPEQTRSKGSLILLLAGHELAFMLEP